MDPAVAMAQAYLQLNGYLTVTEFPIMSGIGAEARAVTDVDLIALRFPDARGLAQERSGRQPPEVLLDLHDGEVDLLICEVKEGKARLNRNLSRQATLTRTLERVGCCPPSAVAHHVDDLLKHGTARMDHGGIPCRARIAVFAGRPGAPPKALVVPLAHAARFVAGFLTSRADELHATRLTQPALAQMELLAKLGLLPSPADHSTA